MFNYRPYDICDNFTLNPIILFDAFLYHPSGVGSNYIPVKTSGENGGLFGVKHNVWPLTKFLGKDLVIELTIYTRLQVCEFLKLRAIFRHELLLEQYYVRSKMEYLIELFQQIQPSVLIWITKTYHRPIYFMTPTDSNTDLLDY